MPATGSRSSRWCGRCTTRAPVRLADHARLVFEVDGDETADRILDDAAAALARTLDAVRSPTVAGPLVLGGGILGRGGQLADRLVAARGADDVPAVADGVLGVCVLALRRPARRRRGHVRAVGGLARRCALSVDDASTTGARRRPRVPPFGATAPTTLFALTERSHKARFVGTRTKAQRHSFGCSGHPTCRPGERPDMPMCVRAGTPCKRAHRDLSPAPITRHRRIRRCTSSNRILTRA